MSKNLDVAWTKKAKGTEHDMQILREDLEKTKEAYSKSVYTISQELKKLSLAISSKGLILNSLTNTVSNYKGVILNELRTKMKEIKHTHETFEDEFDSIDDRLTKIEITNNTSISAIDEKFDHIIRIIRQMSESNKNTELRLSALERNVYYTQKNEETAIQAG
jgi:hypothetical protein